MDWKVCVILMLVLVICFVPHSIAYGQPIMNTNEGRYNQISVDERLVLSSNPTTTANQTISKPGIPFAFNDQPPPLKNITKKNVTVSRIIPPSSPPLLPVVTDITDLPNIGSLLKVQ
jgi:hypothetical protein